MTHKEALQRIDAILTAENTTWQDKKNNLADLICNIECRLSEDGELLAYNCEKRAKQENYERGFMQGQQKGMEEGYKQAVDKACEWLLENGFEFQVYHDQDADDVREKAISMFSKAMEE